MDKNPHSKCGTDHENYMNAEKPFGSENKKKKAYLMPM